MILALSGTRGELHKELALKAIKDENTQESRYTKLLKFIPNEYLAGET